MGDYMNGTTPLWVFNVFILVMLGWFYNYFYSMFNAIADLNDRLISMIQEKTEGNEDDEGQMKLTDFTEEE